MKRAKGGLMQIAVCIKCGREVKLQGPEDQEGFYYTGMCKKCRDKESEKEATNE
jgi:hypothetical protein